MSEGFNIPPSSSPRTLSPLATAATATPYGSPGVPQIPLPASLAQAQASPYGSPRTGSPFLRPDAPSPAPPTPAPVSIDDLSEADKARIVRRHLVSAEEQRAAAHLHAETSAITSHAGSSPTASSSWAAARGDEDRSNASSIDHFAGDDEFPTPYARQGGDVVAPVYKWAAQQGTEGLGVGAGGGSPAGGTPNLRRSKSLVSITSSARRVSHSAGERPVVVEGGEVEPDENASGMGVREILEPGGFRRDFVIRRMASRGDGPAPAGRFTRSFVDFLSLYGACGLYCKEGRRELTRSPPRRTLWRRGPGGD